MKWKELKKILSGIKRDISLKDYTTFKIGGKAKYFYVAETKEDLVKAIEGAKKFDLPFFILGGGSNLLVSDKGYEGVVIKILNTKYKARNTKIVAEAGTQLETLVKFSLEESLTGLEWGAGIPGTLGGAIRGNAGAFGFSTADITETVKILDVQDATSGIRSATSYQFRIRDLKNRECDFGYKNSIFKQSPNLVILSAELRLKKGDRQEIKKQIEANLNYREENHPLNLPSVGCVFKNARCKIQNTELLERYSLLKKFNDKGVIPAGYLIDRAGLKGVKKGEAQISKKHANFIVNLGGAKATNVLKLINLIKKRVKEQFGIELKEEIEYLGF